MNKIQCEVTNAQIEEALKIEAMGVGVFVMTSPSNFFEVARTDSGEPMTVSDLDGVMALVVEAERREDDGGERWLVATAAYWGDRRRQCLVEYLVNMDYAVDDRYLVNNRKGGE